MTPKARGTRWGLGLLGAAAALHLANLLLPALTLGAIALTACLVVKACGQDGTGKPQPPSTAPTVLDPPVTASRRARLERVLALVQLLPPWATAHPDSLSPLAHQARTHTDADIDHLAKKVMEALGQ